MADRGELGQGPGQVDDVAALPLRGVEGQGGVRATLEDRVDQAGQPGVGADLEEGRDPRSRAIASTCSTNRTGRASWPAEDRARASAGLEPG